MANLSVFSFESHEIRFVGTADEPWWVAADVCSVLDIINVSQAIAKLDDDEKLMYTLQISGQGRETLCINESGLYSLVLTSRKAQAKRFKKWLTSEVIPAIRKTGTYSAIAKPQPSLPSQAQKAKLTAHHIHVNALRQEIATTEKHLAELKAQLLTAMRDEVNEAKAFTSAYADVGEEYIRCTEVLARAKALNPYLNTGNMRGGK
ncbi:MAG: Bro-N domain-containing protein [Nostoc sp. EfeVER01]|uniref:BRO-N domain-containing protein n=1 Tax=unclassified Nostoc TaxID=2593658 RepID=UPI002AD31DBD|nr:MULTISPECIES: BRO family protein [unclassified Nostoc]MDZ7949106.1 BRO family protein [Nostoc sp. EfeVER01]MDZ7995447.1 BRO family protein [Nostoc sp. EspVER01]